MEIVYTGEKLKTARLAAGLTQVQLSEATGFTQQSIQRWEKGVAVPSLVNAKRLALAIGCKLDDLC